MRKRGELTKEESERFEEQLRKCKEKAQEKDVETVWKTFVETLDQLPDKDREGAEKKIEEKAQIK
jgi:hypothetical protein